MTMILLVDNHAGVYIPKEFAGIDFLAGTLKGVDSEDMEILKAGPDHPEYWEAWDTVSQNATITDKDGTDHVLYYGECGDLFACPVNEIPED